MAMFRLFCQIALIACVVWQGPGFTMAAPDADDAQQPDAIDYASHIAPLLTKHCLACHGPETQESKFRVDRRGSLLRGGDSGEPAIIPQRSEASHLITLVRGDAGDLVMPPEGERLSEPEILLLKTWIDQGARMPAEENSQVTTDHWSWQPIVRPAVPAVPGVSANPIDAFVLARMAPTGLTMSPHADRATLIRRLFLVMHGLPPTSEQVTAFVQDDRAEAYEKLVENVLDSPHYGERWAQHWLDLIRFGETHGFETNRERPHAWPYRDYVIQVFNDDKPYHEFITEQLAGDAIGVDVATGFLVAGPHDLVKGQDPLLSLMQRQDELADIINTTGTAFLGLTLGCARCHNHKFDPVTQQDFYAIQAVFAGVQHGDRSLPPSPETQRQLAELESQIEKSQAAWNAWLVEHGVRLPVSPRHNVEKLPPTPARFVRFVIVSTANGAEPCLDELEVFAGEKNVALATAGAAASCSSTLPGHAIHQLAHIHDGKYGNGHSWISNEPGGGWVQVELPEVVTIDRIEWARDREGKYADRVPLRYTIEVAVAADQWQVVASSDDRLPPEATADSVALVRPENLPDSVAERARSLLSELRQLESQRDALAQTRTVYAGTFTQPPPTHRLYRGDPLAPREEVQPDALEVLGSLGLDSTTPEQQRRLRFAEWISDANNPLTARVYVNRLWQHHFGTGLVDTPSDFGANGTPPSHPELLDWLAAEFISHGGSTKHLHRLILLSDTFQQTHTPRVEALQIDADTRLLWRFPPRRLEAETIRDSILAVTGVLDNRRGGPGFSGFEVEMENVRHYFPKTSFDERDWRRMIYMTKVRQERDAIFGAFDCPDLSQVTPKRSRSTTPLQALNLFNSQFMLQQAELFAQRLAREVGDDRPAQLRRAFQLSYGRAADEREVADAMAAADTIGIVGICRALLNSNEFLFIP